MAVHLVQCIRGGRFPYPGDELHAQVTGVMIELTAYNIMRSLHELQTERARVAFGRA